MKIIIGAVLSVALIITGFYLWKTSKKNHRMASSVSNILWAGFSMVFFYVGYCAKRFYDGITGHRFPGFDMELLFTKNVWT